MTAGGASGSSRTTTTRLFVDEVIADGEIEGDAAASPAMVRALLGEQVLLLPLVLFPAAVREGDWVDLSTSVIPAPPSDADATRERLAKDDPGGTLKL